MAFDMRQVYKNSWREPSARVPLIVAGPGVPAGARVATPVSLIDLWPTLADLAGVASAPGARGRSLAPLMRGDAAAAAAAASVPVIGEYFAENSNTGAFMVRLGDLKLIAFGTAFPWFAGYAPQLFNVTEDPHEAHDIAAQRPDLVAA
jgi:arylsulfatase A-like enzyme